jgi:8-oxo-dGTP diphosphatase
MKAPVRKIHVVAAALIRDGRCLVAQRAEGSSMALRWEFPGGKVEEGEEPRAALSRELAEELGVTVSVGEHLGRGEAPAGAVRIVLDVYAGELMTGEPRALEHRELRWCSAEELAELDWAEADVPVVSAVERLLREGGGIG